MLTIFYILMRDPSRTEFYEESTKSDESSQCCKSKNKQGVGLNHFFFYYTTPIAQSLVLSCLTWRYVSHNVKTPLIRMFSLFGFHFIKNSLCRLARIFLRHMLLPQLACSL